MRAQGSRISRTGFTVDGAHCCSGSHGTSGRRPGARQAVATIGSKASDTTSTLTIIFLIPRTVAAGFDATVVRPYPTGTPRWVHTPRWIQRSPAGVVGVRQADPTKALLR